MRRCLIPIVMLGLVAAGCGSSSSKSSNPAPTELSYLPASSPLVLSVETDPNGAAMKGANAFAGRFPFASLGEAAAKSKLQQSGINYDSDIRPLLGDPIVFGATGSTLSGSEANNFLFVWMTKDASKLSDLVKKIPRIHRTGSHDGATLYSTGGQTTIALDGATVLLAPSTALVQAALDRHAQGGGITSSEYAKAFAGLPAGGLIKTFGNLTAILANPTAASARRIPWVAAFRGYAATVNATSSGLTFNYRLDTTGGSLAASQLPFAMGTSAPSLAGGLPITVAIHNPSQIAAFTEAAAQTTSPGSFGTFLKQEAALRKKTGTDLDSLLKLLTGDLIISSNTKTTMGRAHVSDPSAAASALAKLYSDPRGAFGKGTKVSRVGDLYAVTDSSGSTILIGVVGNELVVGNARAAQLRQFASAPTTTAAGAHGTVAFRIGLVQFLKIAAPHALPSSVAPLLASLGDITGWLASSPSGVTGSATLAIK